MRVLDRLNELLHRLDRAQKRHPWSAFPMAVVKKFGDDQGGRLAALIAYYGFFSLFPLLLALVTLVAFVIRGNQQLQDQIIHSAIADFPVVGAKIRQTVQVLSGSVEILVLGFLGALWSGLAVVNAIENAMNEIWYVPKAERRGFVDRIKRGFLVLLVFGVIIAVAGFLASLGISRGQVGVLERALSFLASVVTNTAFLAALFRILPDEELSWRDVLPGAVVGAVALATLVSVGAFIVDRKISQATQIYGFFAVVIGLLSWLFLGAQILLVAAEINAVRVRRLWPRSLFPPPLEETDRRALADRAAVERARPEEAVHVHFDRSERAG
jgi:YihY family inner membrane protein